MSCRSATTLYQGEIRKNWEWAVDCKLTQSEYSCIHTTALQFKKLNIWSHWFPNLKMWNQSSTGQTKPHIMCLPGFCSKWKEHKRDRVLIEHSISSGRTWSQTCKSNEVTWSFTRVQDLCYTLVYCSCSGSSPSRLQMSRPSSPRSPPSDRQQRDEISQAYPRSAALLWPPPRWLSFSPSLKGWAWTSSQKLISTT